MFKRVQYCLFFVAVVVHAGEYNGHKLSEQCKFNIETIDQDSKKLFLYCVEAFRDAAFISNFDIPFTITPSVVLDILIAQKSLTNSVVQAKYVSASDYLQIIVKPCYKLLDAAWIFRLQLTQNKEDTLIWFEDYFKTYGIEQPFSCCKDYLKAYDVVSSLPKKQCVLRVLQRR